MSKWEHDWDELGNCIQGIKHYELMTERSSQGWELVTVIIINLWDSQRMRFYWKREMNEGGNND